jgi:hypothetical protein
MNSKRFHYNNSHDTRSDLKPHRVCNGPASTLPAHIRHVDRRGFAVTPTVHARVRFRSNSAGRATARCTLCRG